MKAKTIKIPYFIAWKTKPALNAKTRMLHIRGSVFSDALEQPYLKPLKDPLFFELTFKPLKKVPKDSVNLQLLKDVEHYDQKIAGDEKNVFIHLHGQNKPVSVPILDTH